LLEFDSEVAGISSHSSPDIVRCLRKKGHSSVSIVKDSAASADEMGTGEDLMVARITSEVGNARRLRVEVTIAVDPTGVEKSLKQDHEQRRAEKKNQSHIHTLSAIPPSLPNKHLLLISSWPIFVICSLVSFPPVASLYAILPLVGEADSDRWRTRS
jgi:hypothetical protein